jgi:threonine dehydratase
LEDLPDPDVVIVPCGGGALLAAVAATIKQSLKDAKSCRVYGIEPEGGI